MRESAVNRNGRVGISCFEIDDVLDRHELNLVAALHGDAFDERGARVTFWMDRAAEADERVLSLASHPLFVAVMLIRRVASLLLVVLLGSGCVLLHPWAIPRTLDGSYDQVFQATLETLKARGFPIERVDREKGRIETGKRPVDAMDPYRPVETVRAYVERKEGGKASVRLFMTFLTPRPEVGSSPPRNGGIRSRSPATAGEAVSKSAIYDDYLDAIAERVRAFRGTKPVAKGDSGT